MREFKRYWHLAVLCCLVLALSVTAYVYWGGLNGPFLLDDSVNVTNSYVKNFNWDEIIYEATHNSSGRFGRPVSVLSFIASGLLHGPETWGYKFHNLMLHLLNGLLIFWLFGKILPHINSQLKPQTVWLIAGTTAACWLLHPLMVSTVLYIVQRMAQLSAFFTLAALLVYIFARESVEKSFFRYYTLGFVLFPLCYLLALFSKEDGALIAFYVLAIEGIVFKFKTEHSKEKFRVILFQVVFAIVPIILGALYVLTHLEQLANFASRDFNMVERVLTQLHVLVFYLKLILLPVVSQMSLYHDSWPVVRAMDLATFSLLSLWCGIIALVFICRIKAPMISLGIAWFLISHLMESSIFNLELVFEHRNYLAAAGVLLIMFYYLYSNVRSLLSIIPIVVLTMLVFMTHGRVMEWQNEYTFHTLAVNDHPESYRANIEYANYNLRMGYLEEAVKHLEIAQEIKKHDYGAVLHNLAIECSNEEFASELYNQAISRAERYPVSIYALFGVERLIGMINRDQCQALTRDQMLLLIEVASANEYTLKHKRHYGYLQRQAGVIHFNNGDIGQGIDAFTDAYNNTREFSILAELVNVLLSLEQIESAENMMVLLEQVNRQRWGIEALKINQLNDKIARRKSQRNDIP